MAAQYRERGGYKLRGSKNNAGTRTIFSGFSNQGRRHVFESTVAGQPRDE